MQRYGVLLNHPNIWDILYRFVMNGVIKSKNVTNDIEKLTIDNGELGFFCIFARCMKQGRTETIITRIISTTFVIVALAVFKPFGLGLWKWQAYMHLAALWIIGFITCMITEVIVKYIVRKPRSYDKGVSYIIRRNLYFQIINTPFVALAICLYRHNVLNQFVEGNQFSLVNFLETLAILAFCSFAIGLYWRFKFRSRYLAAELEETRLLNEQLKKLQESRIVAEKKVEATTSEETKAVQQKLPETLILEGSTNEKVTLDILHLLYIEAVGNYVKVCQLRDNEVHTDMLRATMKQVEDDLQAYPMIVRCHRAFLVNLGQVEQISYNSRAMQLIMHHSHDAIPVSRSNMPQVKEAIGGIL